MSDIRFSLTREVINNLIYPHIVWTLSCDDSVLLRILTTSDGREITLSMAVHGIKPLRNCRRWPVKRDSMLRFMKKELAVQAASLDNQRIDKNVYEFLKENYKNIFAGDDHDI